MTLCFVYLYAGRLPEDEAVTCTHYHEVQEPRWVKLAEERLRIIEAKQIFSSELSLSY